MKTLLINGTIIDPSQKLEGKGYLRIEDNKITECALGEAPAPQKDENAIDVKGAYVTPGFIDLHVHLREPGQESKETIESGSNAAVAGGFSTIVCMPNTIPPIDHVSLVKFILLEAQRVGKANVLPTGTISKGRAGEELSEIGEMYKAGIVAITDDGSPVMNSFLMSRASEYAKMFDLLVMDHCEDINFKGSMNEGFYSTKLGLRGTPSISEEIMLMRDIIISGYTGGRIHLQHVSTGLGIYMVRDAKKRGVKITCEVTPHHMSLTDADLEGYDTNFKMSPPLRTEEDRQELIEGLMDGTVDCIATDHAPHTYTNKDVEFDNAPNGIIGMETALPVSYTTLVKENKMPVMRLVELMSTNPAKILRLASKGTLKAGSDADVTVWTADKEYKIDTATFKSRARNCPFQGKSVFGQVEMTIVGGDVKYEA